MLSIKEICKKAGISLYTFQSWRRNDSWLLPRPVAVEKKVIFFDDSILARIKFIREQQAVGKSLTQIEEMLRPQLIEEYVEPPQPHILQAEYDELMEEAKAHQQKWEKADCQDEVCAALKLDPALSGQPTTFCLPAAGRREGSLIVYSSIISLEKVHFAEIFADLYDAPEVRQRLEMPVADFGMLLYLIGQEFAKHRQLLKTEIIPYLLLHGFEGTGATGAYWKEAIEVAAILNKISEAGREYLKLLKNKDIKIP